jgi:hypothetical protein
MPAGRCWGRGIVGRQQSRAAAHMVVGVRAPGSSPPKGRRRGQEEHGRPWPPAARGNPVLVADGLQQPNSGDAPLQEGGGGAGRGRFRRRGRAQEDDDHGAYASRPPEAAPPAATEAMERAESAMVLGLGVGISRRSLEAKTIDYSAT